VQPAKWNEQFSLLKNWFI